MGLTLLIGAARSGKSSLALRMAHAWKGEVTLIATAEARDDEMAARIQRHRSQRPEHWRTVEEPIYLGNEIAALRDDDFAIVDCLTLWVSNVIEHGLDQPTIEEAAREAAKVAATHPASIVVVTNEVGAGIVPLGEVVRAYRDLMGNINRIFADEAERVLLISAGRALTLARPEEVLADLFDR